MGAFLECAAHRINDAQAICTFVVHDVVRHRKEGGCSPFELAAGGSCVGVIRVVRSVTLVEVFDLYVSECLSRMSHCNCGRPAWGDPRK